LLVAGIPNSSPLFVPLTTHSAITVLSVDTIRTKSNRLSGKASIISPNSVRNSSLSGVAPSGHHTSTSSEKLKEIYDKANLKVFP